jgi:Alcohol dehydrogenase transcription factor Myb/SANT-like
LDPPPAKIKKEKKEKVVKTVRSDGKPMPDRLPRTFISEFIDIYKAHECLWKPHSPNYHNRKVKRLAWQKLIEKYREIEKNPTKKTVLRKIGSLRTTFRKEYTRVERAKNTWQPHKPKLWYYDQFSFIIVDPGIEDVTVKEDHKAIVEMKEEMGDDEEVGSSPKVVFKTFLVLILLFPSSSWTKTRTTTTRITIVTRTPMTMIVQKDQTILKIHTTHF